jgi:hypothetical protein
MKKRFTKFSENILNNIQLKELKGGYGGGYGAGTTCEATCKHGSKATCSGAYKCEAVNYDPMNGEPDGFCLSYETETTQWPNVTWCNIV